MTLRLLPQSYNYGLVVISYATVYRGDGVIIILPRFELQSYLEAIQKYVLYGTESTANSRGMEAEGGSDWPFRRELVL